METALKYIVTGFKPFAGHPINASWEAVKLVKTKRNGAHIQEMTVDHLSAHAEINLLLENTPCDILLLSGVSPYHVIKMELQATKPIELSHISGPSLLRGNWPWKENLSALNESGIPAETSQDAGKYVCESIYWSALNFRRINGYPQYVSFLHVPVLSPQWDENKIAGAMVLSLDLLSNQLP